MALKYIVVVLSVAAIAACGGKDDTKDGDAPSLSVGVDPASLSVTIGASATATVTLTRTKLDGASVALAVSGMPSGVTATFDSAATTTNTATLTVTAAAGTSAGASSLTITATPDGAAAATTTLALTLSAPPPMTVTGTVLNAQVLPVAGVIVHVLGSGAASLADATTAADGTFTVTNIVPPYDVNVISDGVNFVFLGVTSPTPKLGSPFSGTVDATTISATFDIKNAQSDFVDWDIESATSLVHESEANALTSNNQSFTRTAVPSATAGSTAVTVSAIFYTSDGTNPTDYIAMSQQAETITNAGPNTITLDASSAIALDKHSINVQARAAGGGPVELVGVDWIASPHNNHLLYSVVPNMVESTVLVPVRSGSGPALDLVLSASSGFNFVFRSVTPTTTEVDIDIPTPPDVTSPADLSANVSDATVFSTNTDAGPATYLALLLIPAGGVRAVIASGSPSFTAARLRSVSAGLAPGSSYKLAFAHATGGTSTDPFTADHMSSIGFGAVQGQLVTSAFISFSTSP
jgi:hypothetical protein